MPSVKTINLLEGMVISAPVQTSKGREILNGGTVVSEDIIKTLDIWGIKEVEIREESTLPTVSKSIFFEEKIKSLEYLSTKFHLLEGEFYEILIDACAERINKKNLKFKSND